MRYISKNMILLAYHILWESACRSLPFLILLVFNLRPSQPKRYYHMCPFGSKCNWDDTACKKQGKNAISHIQNNIFYNFFVKGWEAEISWHGRMLLQVRDVVLYFFKKINNLFVPRCRYFFPFPLFSYFFVPRWKFIFLFSLFLCLRQGASK